MRASTHRAGLTGLVCALALGLSGCSGAQLLSDAPRAGYQDNGTYVLTAQEQDQGCRALQERSMGLQDQMTKLSQQAVQQMQEVPNTVAAAWKRLVGSPGDGVPAIEQYNEARAESAALQTEMSRKGCAPATTASIR